MDDNEGSVLTIPDEAKSEAEVKSEAEAEGEMIYESQPQLVVPTFRLPADDDADALARFPQSSVAMNVVSTYLVSSWVTQTIAVGW